MIATGLLTLVVVLLVLSRSAPRGAASVALLGITNGPTGQRLAVLAFTNAGSLGVAGFPHSVDYKLADAWLTQQPVPAVVVVDVAAQWGTPVVLRPHESRVVAVRYPTNATWRFRIRYHEQRRGVPGAYARLTDFAHRLFTRSEHTSFTGESYLRETLEIPH